MNERVRVHLARDLQAIPESERHRRGAHGEVEEADLGREWIGLDDAVSDVMSVLVLVIDQASKLRAVAALTGREPIPLLGRFLRLRPLHDAGAITHLADRLFHGPGFGFGKVVDFIDDNGWFVGNLADVVLTCGVVVLVVGSLLRTDRLADGGLSGGRGTRRALLFGRSVGDVQGRITCRLSSPMLSVLAGAGEQAGAVGGVEDVVG